MDGYIHTRSHSMHTYIRACKHDITIHCNVPVGRHLTNVILSLVLVLVIVGHTYIQTHTYMHILCLLTIYLYIVVGILVAQANWPRIEMRLLRHSFPTRSIDQSLDPRLGCMHAEWSKESPLP
jgi:hypothetical protein